VDAYCNYILKLSEARADDLRREAAEYALSRKSRHIRSGFLRRRQASGPVAAPVAVLPHPEIDDDDRELSRIA
jgi:hypothetical protein